MVRSPRHLCNKALLVPENGIPLFRHARVAEVNGPEADQVNIANLTNAPPHIYSDSLNVRIFVATVQAIIRQVQPA